MDTLKVYIDGEQDAASAMGRVASLWQAADGEAPGCLYVAGLQGSAVVLGQYQRARSALRIDGISAPVLRRLSGGQSVWAGDGMCYLALILRDPSALMKCPRGKILNRNVRGFLQGIRNLDVPAYYFGRDWLSLTDARPGAYLAWTQSADGRVLLEVFLGASRSFLVPPEAVGYPEGAEPRFRGKQPITLSEAGVKDASTGKVGEAMAEGHAQAYGVAWEPGLLGDLDQLTQAHDFAVTTPPDLSWSDPIEEAIGWVQAGVEVDRVGVLHQLELAGDFFQERAARPALLAELVGNTPTTERVGRALDQVYGQGGFVLEGIRTLESFRSAIAEAVAAAHCSE